MIPALKTAVERELESTGSGSRRSGAKALSDIYRAGGRSIGIDFAAYLTARLPATFAAVDRVLKEVVRQRPDLNPASLLDVGSGPGTAAWAAVGHWPDLSRITFIDNNRSFLDLALRLSQQGTAQLASAEGIVASLDRLPDGISADVVVAGYALAERPEAGAAVSALHLWERTSALLVLLEPGTPAGFARIRSARRALLAEGAVPVAPCPHANACPMTGNDWCHFSVRLARSRAHMHAKGAEVPFEDEKFSYLVVSRTGAPSGGARVLARPRDSKAGIDFRLCEAEGLADRHIARRNAKAYKALRKCLWGDYIGDARDAGGT